MSSGCFFLLKQKEKRSLNAHSDKRNELELLPHSKCFGIKLSASFAQENCSCLSLSQPKLRKTATNIIINKNYVKERCSALSRLERVSLKIQVNEKTHKKKETCSVHPVRSVSHLELFTRLSFNLMRMQQSAKTSNYFTLLLSNTASESNKLDEPI